MPKVDLDCVECGTRFQRFPSTVGRFCSQSCRSRYSARPGMPNKPRRGDTIPCDHCGKPLYRCAGEIRRDRRYCSSACRGAGQTKPPIIKQCARCGLEMRLQQSKGYIQYCSRGCAGLARTKRPLGRIHNGRPARCDKYGYVLVWEPTHPNPALKGWQYEHRLVVEATISRYLRSDEDVHHVNGVKDDNRPENLKVMAHTDHMLISSRDYRDQVLRNKDELAEYRRRFGLLTDFVPLLGRRDETT